MVPGTKTSIRAALESPEATEASAVWATVMFRSFLHRLLGARDLTDIQIAAGAALQDLDEWQGIGAEWEHHRAAGGQQGHASPEADLV